MQKLLDAIQVISNEARRALADPDVPRELLLSGLSVCPQTVCLVFLV